MKQLSNIILISSLFVMMFAFTGCKSYEEIETEDTVIELYKDGTLEIKLDSKAALNRLNTSDIIYENVEDVDLEELIKNHRLFNVKNGKEINLDQLKQYKDTKLVIVSASNTTLMVEGEILVASKDTRILEKDSIYLDKNATHYIMFVESSEINKVILWILLVTVIIIATYLSIKWQSNKKIEEALDCDKCGTRNEEDALFCKGCGEKIT